MNQINKMKKLSLTVFLGLFLITPSWGDEHDLSLYKSILKQLEGNYCGFLEYDSGHKFRIISTFKINEQNNIWGNYVFENYDRDKNKEDFGDGEVYKGVFFKGKIENTHKKFSAENIKFKIFWIDDFGDGYLDINLENVITFKGDWGFHGSTKHEGTWDGSRCDPETGEILIR